MKNLSLILNLDVKVRDCEGADFVFFRGKCPKSNDFIDSDEEVFFIKEKYLYRLNLAKGTTKVISLSDVYDSGASQILSITYNEITEEFYSFHRDGEVFSFRVSSDGSTATGQISQTIEGGITAVVWSPDEEFGALVNSKNELFILTANCDVMNYWDLQDDTEGEHQFINVGWGKKETQFQGSAGKAAAYAKPEQVNADEVKDEKSVRVSWRGDSSIFAVSYWDTRDNKRKIKIFSREGLLQCCGEDIAGLEEPLCWRPQGNITMVQRLPNKHVIAFMEKNGLKHYDFPLPDGLTVVDLYWNQDSQILCSYCIEAKTESPLLLMWTTKNYHWYLKYTYTCPSPPVSVMWDCKRENRLKIAYNNGNVNVLEFIWSVDHSGYSSSDDKSYISVIDNDTLLVSQFSAAVVPPPMSMWSLKFDDPVRQICYPLQASIYSLAAICGEHIGLITKDADNELAIKKRLKIDADGINLKHSYSWLWIKEQTFACCTPNADLQTDLLLMHTIDDQLNLKWKTTLPFPTLSLVARKSALLVGKLDGSYVSFPLDETNATGSDRNILPELCLNPVAWCDQLIGLSESGRLYIDDSHVASNITSFLVAFPFLIATTSLHTLLILKFNPNKCEEISCRKVENGSKLILATGTSVVLQMPRGNLETIHPRALTFVSIGDMLENFDYRQAVQTLRKNRILLDVCVDHNPDLFLKNVDTFVDQVDPHSLVILISELSKADVTMTMYGQFYSKERTSLKDKVNRVCSALFEGMNKTDRIQHYSLPILSCLVKMDKVDEAIKLADSDQALQHLLFLVPVEKLYAYALEAYNLPAALRIAGKSQMDPKEYVPYLNELREMDPNYMKFAIDKNFKKYASALTHLAQCNQSTDDDCFAFIEEHNLYREGLNVFQNGTERYQKCARLYGEFFFKKRIFEEAAIMFCRGGCPSRAIEAYSCSNNWRRAFSLAKQLQYSEQQLSKLARDLLERLIASNSYRDAAQICEQYLNDFSGALDAYTLGYFWDEALLVAERSDLQDQIDTKIKPRIKEQANSIIAELNSRIDLVSKYVARLRIVRTEKANRPRFQDFDAMSETSSVSSRSATSHTSKSSRMTKKASRKLWSLKEGNPREEEALLAALREIYLNSEKYPGEVEKLSCTLMYLNLDEIAIQVHNGTKSLLNVCRENLSTIWPKDPNEEPTAALDSMIKCPPEIHIPSNWGLQSLASD